MFRYEEKMGLDGGMLLANHAGGLDVPYKLVKYVPQLLACVTAH